MNRRTLLKSLIMATFTPFFLNASTNIKTNESKSKLSMIGDLDDDLIILKSNSSEIVITNIYQMHNSSGIFSYDGNSYKIEHNPGYINFTKDLEIDENEIYVICLANESDDAGFSIDKRFRTHFKNEKVLFNNEILLKALMPEYNSVPNYPLWFNEGDYLVMQKFDINGNTYNYYNLHENSVVQVGIILPKSAEIEIMLFNSKNDLKYTYKESVNSTCNYLESNELKNGELKSHPFTEVNNILNLDINNQIDNDEYITHMVINHKGKLHNIKFPYPFMYPNLLAGVAVKN